MDHRLTPIPAFASLKIVWCLWIWGAESNNRQRFLQTSSGV